MDYPLIDLKTSSLTFREVDIRMKALAKDRPDIQIFLDGDDMVIKARVPDYD